MIIDTIEWVQSLKKGDSVGCTYGSLKAYITKVEYVLTNCRSVSGYAVKLEGIDNPIDISWIFPHIS
jgi:hypothetical protein